MLIQGLTFMNSPSWNLHPAFSEELDFIDIRIKAPWDSPNTDGFDPESCRRVRLLGTEISVGGDCIALKSGKIRLGKKYRQPSFAAGCSREVIARGAELLGWTLDELLEKTLDAMKALGPLANAK